MLDPDPNPIPKTECISVPIPLRQKVEVPHRLNMEVDLLELEELRLCYVHYKVVGYMEMSSVLADQ
jgi:hypothetical protein